jgi:DNA-binding beta-propeller fold protein YncE
MALSPDGRWLYVVEDENSQRALQIIDTATGQLQSRVIQLRDRINPRFITPRRGTQLYIMNDRSVDVLNTQTQQIERSLSFPVAWAGPIEGAMLSPDQQQLYVVNSMFDLAIFDLAEGTLVEERALPAPVRNAALDVFAADSADGTRLVVGQNPLIDLGGYHDGKVVQPGTSVVGELVVYDTRTWQPVQQIGLDRPVETLAVNADGSLVYAVVTSSPIDFETAPDVGPLASMLGGKNSVVTFDMASGQVLAEREQEKVMRLFVAP